MKEISDFISSVGFPIVVCLLMIYQQEKLSRSYIDIVQSLKELISNNTKSINLLLSQVKENDDKMISIMGGNNEDKQKTSQSISNNE